MFASILKELRKSAKYTQDQLAEALSVPVRTYGSWERGERQPDFETLSKIADFYNVTADYLLGRPPMKVVPLEGDPPEEMEGYHHFVFEPDEQLDENDMAPLIRKILAEELKKRGL